MTGRPNPLDQRPADDVTAIFEARTAVASKFLRGTGIEVGAGARAFPHPVSARILDGDIRERNALEKYFQESESENEIKIDEYIDAQTFAGIKNESLDFVISAHVIEHLRDPIGSIVNATRAQTHWHSHFGCARHASHFRPGSPRNNYRSCPGGLRRRRREYLSGILRRAPAVCASNSNWRKMSGSGNSTASGG
jgi:hypothetical protein